MKKPTPQCGTIRTASTTRVFLLGSEEPIQFDMHVGHMLAELLAPDPDDEGCEP
jgi:hypothetical protein